MPAIHLEIGERAIMRNNERGDIGQNVSGKKIPIVCSVGFDARIKSEAAMDQFGNCLHLEFSKIDCSNALEAKSVSSAGEKAHRFGVRLFGAFVNHDWVWARLGIQNKAK